MGGDHRPSRYTGAYFAPVMKKENIMNKIRMMSILVILALIFNVSPAYAAYTLTDLGTLGGSTSGALAINEAGQVVGLASIAGDVENHAFVWEGGVMTDLGTFGGSYTTPVAINEA